MTHRHRHSTQLLLAGILVSGCGGDSAGPRGSGTLEVSVVTTGVDIDADGFSLSVDGNAPQSIPVNGISSISAAPGGHALAIVGLAVNCDVTAPATAYVFGGKSTRVNVAISCGPHLHNVVVYVSDQFAGGQLMVMRPDGSRREALTADPVYYNILPAVSPDGQTIAVESGDASGNAGIFLLDRFGNGRTKVIHRSNLDGDPAWSPDGTKLAFSSASSSGNARIFVINRDGTGLRQLTIENNPQYGSTEDETPGWSPNGQQIVFSRLSLLYLINADGSGIDSTGVHGLHPAWSPDGTQIAFADGAIYIMDQAFKTRRLTASASDGYPRWSPDGRQLVFERAEGLQYRLYRINSDGTGLTKLTTTPPNDRFPTWSPLP